MAGIYVHIPFCKKACHYCNFHFSTSRQGKPEMISAIGKEAILRSDYLAQKIETLYFGGGTPSLLSKEELQSIIETIRKYYAVAPDAEITLETNPDDITTENLSVWKASGINRLSIGIQSFFEEDLQWMNRAHNAAQAKQSIEWAQQAGFSNITIDLIYGSPGLTDEKWLHNIETALALQITHLSCYALTVEPKTALAKKIETRQLEDVDPTIQARQFSLLTARLNDAGFEQYEISNFAVPGHRSRHNSSYWQGKPYLGLGPSAHSFNGKSRQWNIANNTLYVSSIERGIIPFEEEILTSAQQLNEYIMTALRTIEGISLAVVTERWGAEKAELLKQSAVKYLLSGKLAIENGILGLTVDGKFFADGIAADLFQL
ncbi:MAG: radical SAM family heme chaperone HemW [Bacteroidota bacterium]